MFNFFLAGKFSDGVRPVRNPFNTWYISREVWPYDTYPLWLQGMVYLLSPSNTADLFQAALRTHYMLTDDVFIGILVNKTAKPGQKSLIIGNISAYGSPGYEEEICQTWIDGYVPFFHIPDSRLYLSWFHWELEGFQCSPQLKQATKVCLAVISIVFYSFLLLYLHTKFSFSYREVLSEVLDKWCNRKFQA